MDWPFHVVSSPGFACVRTSIYYYLIDIDNEADDVILATLNQYF